LTLKRGSFLLADHRQPRFYFSMFLRENRLWISKDSVPWKKVATADGGTRVRISMSMPLALATLSPCCETPDIHPRHNYTLGFKEETVDVSESKPGRGELRVMVVLLLDERGLVSGTASLLVREDVLYCNAPGGLMSSFPGASGSHFRQPTGLRNDARIEKNGKRRHNWDFRFMLRTQDLIITSDTLYP